MNIQNCFSTDLFPKLAAFLDIQSLGRLSSTSQHFHLVASQFQSTLGAQINPGETPLSFNQKVDRILDKNIRHLETKDVLELKNLIAQQSDLDDNTNLSSLLVKVCSFTNSYALAKLLLNKGADPRKTDTEGFDAFYYAKLTNQEALSELLEDAPLCRWEELQQAYSSLTPEEIFLTILNQIPTDISFSKGMKDLLAILSQSSFNINNCSSLLEDSTILHLIADRSLTLTTNKEFKEATDYFHSLISALIKKGVDVNAQKGDDLFTPLHVAVAKKNIPFCKALIKCHASVEIRSKTGLTPLAIWSQHVHDQWEGQVQNQWEDEEIFSLLIASGANLNTRDERGKTCLHLALERNSFNPQAFELLLNAGADLQAQDNQGRTPLHLAALYQNLNVIDQLIEDGADVNIRDDEELLPWDLAARANKGHFVLNLLKTTERKWEELRKIYPHETPQDIFSIILSKITYLTPREEGIESLRAILHYAPIDLNALTRNNSTILQEIIQNPDAISSELYRKREKAFLLSFLSFLVKKGADIDAQTSSCPPPLHLAASRKNLFLCDILVELGANVNSRSNKGYTPLISWCLSTTPGFKFIHSEDLNEHDTKILDFLVAHGANVNLGDKEGKTLLHHGSGSLKLCNALLAHFPDVNAKDNQGRTPLYEAATRSHFAKAAFNRLVEAGGDLNAQDLMGNTLLHYALGDRLIRQKELCIEILSYPVNVNIKNHQGQTPLFYALERHRFEREVFDLLLAKGTEFPTQDNQGHSLFYPLIHFYNYQKRQEALEWMLERGLNINALAPDGSTLLHWAAAECHDIEEVKFFVSYGASANIRNKQKVFPKDVAFARGKVEIFNYLKSL